MVNKRQLWAGQVGFYDACGAMNRIARAVGKASNPSAPMTAPIRFNTISILVSFMRFHT